MKKNPKSIGGKSTIADSEDFIYEDHWGKATITASDLKTEDPVIINIQPEIAEPMDLFDQLQRLVDQGLVEVTKDEVKATAKAYDELERLRAGIGPKEAGPQPETMSLVERFGYELDRKLRFSF